MRSACSPRAVADQRAHEGDRLLRLLGRRDLPGADRPDRLVGDHDVAEPLGRRPCAEVLLHLVAELALGVAALALLLGLADAQDRQQPGLERRRDLQLRAPRSVSPKYCAALGVPEDDAVDADLARASAARPRR